MPHVNTMNLKEILMSEFEQEPQIVETKENYKNRILGITGCFKKGINDLEDLIDESYTQAIELIKKKRGRILTCGIGKSGFIAKKAAASLASTGTPAYFVHPSEAAHGDLGMITKDDALFLVSYSGKSAELLPVMYYAKNIGCPIIAIVSNTTSVLAKNSNVVLKLPVVKEPTDLPAPFISTALSLVVFDIISVLMMEEIEFNKDDYAKLHPGGKIGSVLKLVGEVMHKGDELPLVYENQKMSEVIIEISNKKLGCACVVDSNRHLVGVITDGDLSRHMHENLLSEFAHNIMTKNPRSLTPNMLISEAFEIIKDKKITNFPVVDEDKNIVGMLHIHDIIKLVGDE
ncbi:MAG: KpsF/GutQ family sugar-phosphate isomerase [Sphingobacteriia bacterium]|nr:KpsF/GutQ family sugar-phosphate isomerase [Sphingobacteriia bacterium]